MNNINIMALTEQEREIVNFGKENGKNKDQILKAISNYRNQQGQQTQNNIVDSNIGTGFNPTFESEQDDSLFTSAAKTVGNVPRSVFQLGKDVFTAVTNPIETGKAVMSTISGASGQAGASFIENTDIGQNFAQSVDNFRQSQGLPPLERQDGKILVPDTEDMKIAGAVGNYFSERYGSVDNFRESVVEDPAGVLADIASAVSGAGAGIKQAGNISRTSRVSQAGSNIANFGNQLEPITTTQRILSNIGGRVSQSLPGRIFSEAAPTPGRFAEGEIVKALDLTQGDIRKISQKTGNDVSDFVTRNNLLRETPEEIALAVDDLKNTQYNAVRSEVANVNNVYNKSDVPRVNDALNAVKNVTDDVPGLEEVSTEVNRLINQEQYSLADVQRVKEILDENTNIYTRSGDISSAKTAQGLANVRSELRKFIEDEVSTATGGNTNIQKLNNDVATSRELTDAIELRESRDLTRNYSPLTSTLLGGAAFAGTGDIFTALGVAGASKLIQTPSFRIALARTLKSTPAQDLSKWSKEIAEQNLSPQTRQSLINVINEARQNAQFIESGAQVIDEASEEDTLTQ